MKEEAFGKQPKTRNAQQPTTYHRYAALFCEILQADRWLESTPRLKQGCTCGGSAVNERFRDHGHASIIVADRGGVEPFFDVASFEDFTFGGALAPNARKHRRHEACRCDACIEDSRESERPTKINKEVTDMRSLFVFLVLTHCWPKNQSQ
jgi:hypothetical protein